MLGLCWPILGLCWPILELWWPMLGLCWPILGAMLAHLGAMLAHFAAYVGPCWPILSHKIRKMGKSAKSTKHRKTRQFLAVPTLLRLGRRPLSPTERRETPAARTRPGGPWPDSRLPPLPPTLEENTRNASFLPFSICFLILCFKSWNTKNHRKPDSFDGKTSANCGNPAVQMFEYRAALFCCMVALWSIASANPKKTDACPSLCDWFMTLCGCL